MSCNVGNHASKCILGSRYLKCHMSLFLFLIFYLLRPIFFIQSGGLYKARQTAYDPGSPHHHCWSVSLERPTSGQKWKQCWDAGLYHYGDGLLLGQLDCVSAVVEHVLQAAVEAPSGVVSLRHTAEADLVKEQQSDVRSTSKHTQSGPEETLGLNEVNLLRLPS